MSDQPISPLRVRMIRQRQTSRGFLHWRLPDDGPGACGEILRAVVRSPSQ